MRAHVDSLIERLYPGATVERVRAFGVDEAADDAATEKGVGYGEPLRITVRLADGGRRDLVLHTATRDAFGHDRRSDRAEEMLLAYDTFGAIDRHVAAVDVGFIEPGGNLRSVRDSGEFYLVTEYAPGALYADDLRRIARDRAITDRDRARCDTLAGYLARLHTSDRDGDRDSASNNDNDGDGASRAVLYTRAIRDLVGHGEGIFGLIDNFAPDVPAAPPDRMRAIERACVDWRWRLRGRAHRLARTHGDFHPFNILFDDADELAVLDAARGGRGDPADDAVCLALNYVFFAVGHDGAWAGNLGALWRRFWDAYLDQTGDAELLEVAPPFVAWRGLVMANPVWYPAVTAGARELLLSLIERTLAAGRFDLDSVESLFA